ncbi:hypothetical protein C0989_010209, partial [Termitomyces sp. Mn162]
RAQLATELIISAEEFDVYNIFAPTTIAFHLREFNVCYQSERHIFSFDQSPQATIAYADSMSLAIDLRFTDPAAPLFMDIEGDNSDSLFVISTSQVHGASTATPSQNYVAPNVKKREREETPLNLKNKKPLKAAHRVDPRAPSVPPSFRCSAGHAPPTPRVVPSHALNALSQDMTSGVMASQPFAQSEMPREPLFLPSPSQLSAVDKEVLCATGLGIEAMDANELAEMLDGEGEEVVFDFASQDPKRPESNDDRQRSESFELECDAAEIPPTQNSEDAKTFQALFDD